MLIVVALAVERLVPPLTGAVRVADGDSLVVAGERVRLDGIDAPELHQSCGEAGREWPCGARAKAALEAIVAEGEVSCRPVDEDRYGRAVAVCELSAKEGGAKEGGANERGAKEGAAKDRAARDLGARQVAAGWALATDGAYAREEAQARAAGKGIWSGPFDMPAEWRARHPRPPE